MVNSNFTLHYDGVCVYANIKIKISVLAKFILMFLNVALISIIVLFASSGVGIAAVFFTLIQVFLLKYTLWNLYGTENLIINTKSISYQYGYGFFVTTMTTLMIHKAVKLGHFNSIKGGEQNYMNFLFSTFDDAHLPTHIYQSTLKISETEYQQLVEAVDHLYLDQLSEDFLMPVIHMN